jgi:hypothetical protein
MILKGVHGSPPDLEEHGKFVPGRIAGTEKTIAIGDVQSIVLPLGEENM